MNIISSASKSVMKNGRVPVFSDAPPVSDRRMFSSSRSLKTSPGIVVFTRWIRSLALSMSASFVSRTRLRPVLWPLTRRLADLSWHSSTALNHSSSSRASVPRSTVSTASAASPPRRERTLRPASLEYPLPSNFWAISRTLSLLSLPSWLRRCGSSSTRAISASLRRGSSLNFSSTNSSTALSTALTAASPRKPTTAVRAALQRKRLPPSQKSFNTSSATRATAADTSGSSYLLNKPRARAAASRTFRISPQFLASSSSGFAALLSSLDLLGFLRSLVRSPTNALANCRCSFARFLMASFFSSGTSLRKRCRRTCAFWQLSYVSLSNNLSSSLFACSFVLSSFDSAASHNIVFSI
mmetsp:Transcript_131593/g.366735  ORF Transcript_131593/g.366735 Transcript_131593/m.366735 type:complete len:355 (+) Transcript_131593:511-1575(+)